MNFDDTPEEAAFRLKARQWLDANALLRSASRGGAADDEASSLAEARAFQAKKAEAGYAAITWPKDLGGMGGTSIQHLIFGQEQSRYRVSSNFFSVGLGMCIPTVMKFGSDAHRERYVRPALSGQEIWCQLFSEPAGGSDVAAVRTLAVRQGDGWVVNGQKIWTSGAHYSDFGILLARTDVAAPKHKGLTMFIVDMRSPGVEIRPIRQMTGGSDFNEVFFSDVRIPEADRLGQPGEGWKVALTTLMHERLSVGGTFGGFLGWRDLLNAARENTIAGRPAAEDGRIRERIADSWVVETGKRLLGYRAQTALSRGQTPGPEQSILKLLTTAKPQENAYVVLDLLGEGGAVRQGELGSTWRKIEHSWSFGAALRIAGGTDEILRNIIAERVLGLPQDIRLDKDAPFNSLTN